MASSSSAAASAVKNALKSAVQSAVDIFATAKAASVPAATITSLQEFRVRHEQLRSKVDQLQSMRLDVDFDSYRRVLRNKDIVNKAESAFKAFRPRELDTSRQHEIINAYEKTAVEKAEAATSAINSSVNELVETLDNIDKTRSVENLTLRNYLDALPMVEAEILFRNKHKYYEFNPEYIFVSTHPRGEEIAKAWADKELAEKCAAAGH